MISPGMTKWCKPSAGYIKMNCDASTSRNRGSGIGLIGRNEDGVFYFVVARSNEFIEDPEIAEA